MMMGAVRALPSPCFPECKDIGFEVAGAVEVAAEVAIETARDACDDLRTWWMSGDASEEERWGPIEA